MVYQWEPGERLGQREAGSSMVPPTSEAEQAALLSRMVLKFHLKVLEGRNLAMTSKGLLALVLKAVKYRHIVPVMLDGVVLYVCCAQGRGKRHLN
jgi:hypothetical protein